MRLWLRICGVTAVLWHTSPPISLPSPPQPSTDCAESLTVTLRSLCPRFCEQETVDDQFETFVLPWRKAAAYGYTWLTHKHACWTGMPPPSPPPTSHKHTNKGLHKLSCDVLWCIFLVTLRCCMQLCHQTKETGLFHPVQNIIYCFKMHCCMLVDDF